MAIDTVAVTGGNGFLGRAVIETLNEEGYGTVNLARGTARHEQADAYVTTDLLDAGNVYGALARTDADAVVHAGTIPSPLHHPGYATYESNVQSAYLVLEAAIELGLESAALASSINAIGSSHQDPPVDVRYLPVDEAHPATPHDPYGIAKRAMEVTAAGLGRQAESLTISSLRYPWIADDDALRERFVSADRTLDGLRASNTSESRDVLFSYIHLDDAANAAVRAIESDHEGHERFWTVAADTSAAVDSERLAEEFYPAAERRRPIPGTASLIDIGKARDVLDWTPARSWRDLREAAD